MEKGSGPLPAPGWFPGPEGDSCPEGAWPPSPPLTTRCPWEQAPSCLQELDAVPFPVVSRTLYKGRKQQSRLRASSGEDGWPGGEAQAWGGNGARAGAPSFSGTPQPRASALRLRLGGQCLRAALGCCPLHSRALYLPSAHPLPPWLGPVQLSDCERLYSPLAWFPSQALV